MSATSLRRWHWPSLCPRRGDIKRWCCLTSVCLTVAYIGPKSRTERPRKTKIGTEVVHVTHDSDTIFKVKRSKVKVTLRLPAYSLFTVLDLDRYSVFQFDSFCFTFCMAPVRSVDHGVLRRSWTRKYVGGVRVCFDLLKYHNLSLNQNCSWITLQVSQSSRMKDLCQKWKVKLIFRGAWNSSMAWPDWY